MRLGIKVALEAEMTRRRFKFGLAALGMLAAFVIALLGLLLVPTHASADKNSGTTHRRAHHSSTPPDLASEIDYTERAGGNDFGSVNWSALGRVGGACPYGLGSCTDQKEGSSLAYIDGHRQAASPADSSDPSSGTNQDSQRVQGNPFSFGLTGGGLSLGAFGSGNSILSAQAVSDPFEAGGSDPGDASRRIQNLLPTDPPSDGPDADVPIFLSDSPLFENGPTTSSAGTTHTVPEPLTLWLFAAGLAGAAAIPRGRAKRA
jgi:hypothetical protein